MTTRKSSEIGIPVVLAATVPVLVVRLGLTFVRMKVKRRGAVRRFRRELLRGGMTPAHADRFAADYEALGRLRAYLPGGWRRPRFPITA